MKDKEFVEISVASIKRSTSPERNVSMIPAINRINQSNSGNSTIHLTPRSIRSRNGSTFQSFPIVHTPTPPSCVQRIINPFEVGLADRLHLPFIGSPSLFRQAETPKHCSTPTQSDFEWTIDEVSSLNPANVEAHETQFITQVDPDVEAKAQAAISSFFKEHVIVPSPTVNLLREQQQQLLTNVDTPSSSQMRKRWRSTTTQTELTLPPILPADLEAALKPYFTFTQEQQQNFDGDDGDITMNSVFSDTTIDHEARDASLRRKLFHHSPTSSEVSSVDFQRDELKLDSPPPQIPKMVMKLGYSRTSGGPPNDAFTKFEEIFSDNYEEFANGIFECEGHLIDDVGKEDNHDVHAKTVQD